MRGGLGGREHESASNQGLGALWPSPRHSQNGVLSIPQGGVQWAGGRKEGLGEGDKYLLYVIFSLASLGMEAGLCLVLGHRDASTLNPIRAMCMN